MVSHEIAIKNINYLLPSTSTYTQGTWLGLLFFGGNTGETFSCKTSILRGGGQKLAAVRLLRCCSHILLQKKAFIIFDYKSFSKVRYFNLSAPEGCVENHPLLSFFRQLSKLFSVVALQICCMSFSIANVNDVLFRLTASR